MVKTKLDASREELYRSLEQRVGNTPLAEFTALPVPNGNRIFLKDESDTVRGAPVRLNHYGRVYLHTFRELEEEGEIKPGDAVYDTSSGNAVLAMSFFANQLGFIPYAVIPEVIAKTEMAGKLKEVGARIIALEGDYVKEFANTKKIAEIKMKLRKELGRAPFFLNHSMGPNHANNEVTLKSLEPITAEVLQQMPEYGAAADYFVGVWGNGSSLYGPGRLFKQQGTRIVGWELFSQADAYEHCYPGRYEDLYGILLGTLGNIHVRGASYRGPDGTSFNFPHIINAVQGPRAITNDTRLVVNTQILERYRGLAGSEIRFDMVRRFPNLDVISESLREAGCDYGLTTVGSIAVALDMAKSMKDKAIVTLIYERVPTA